MQEDNINTKESEAESEVTNNQKDKHDEIVHKLATEIKRLQEESANHIESIMREKAENDNLRKRYTRELEDTAKYVISEFAKDLIEVLESLYKAVEYKKEFDMNDSKVNGMFDGMNMTLKLLEKAFTKNGIQRVYPAQEEFDHRFHQAISKLSVQDKKHNQIIDVIQAGYTIQDRLLKPALVVVNVAEE